MSRGPLPSDLCSLSSLPKRRVGDKVRFVGCVISYSASTASLCLGHAYPPGSSVTASVNIELVLQAANQELTRVGEWVNVIGYITANPKTSRPDAQSTHVQALLVWSTGPLDIQIYEKGLGDRSDDTPEK